MCEPMLDAEDRHAAWVAGWDEGEAHGRAAERGLIAQERMSARAAEMALAMSEWPVRDPEADRAAAEARDARWAR